VSPWSDARVRALSTGVLLLAVLLVVAGTVHVPLVALTPGPTADTLGSVHGTPVVAISGRPVYPTTGRIDMTTVQVNDGFTAVDAFAFWLDPHAQLLPRAAIYPPGQTDDQVQRQNSAQFSRSESDAEVAALTYLGQPVKVVVGPLTQRSPSAGVLRPGDQLVRVQGQRVTSPAQVSQSMRATRPGQDVPVAYQRGTGPVVQAAVKVGARPAEFGGGPHGFLGITPSGQPEDPRQIVISLADVGGPSAGLAFALAIVDKLTPDDLAGGRTIAGTGEIDQFGEVLPIGGITLKMVGARHDGATVFLTPAANCAEAVGHVPDGLRLIKVSTLADAVAGLTALKQGRPVPGC
jgi:PDZ domain-containing protein